MRAKRGPFAFPCRPRPSRSENRKCRNSLSALAGLDVEKPYGQKAALFSGAVHNNQMFRRCCAQATDSGQTTPVVNHDRRSTARLRECFMPRTLGRSFFGRSVHEVAPELV